MLVFEDANKQCCKLQPVGFGAVQKPVKGILGEGFTERTCSLLHIHAPPCEHVAELIFKDPGDRNTLFLLSIASTKQISNLKSAEK